MTVKTDKLSVGKCKGCGKIWKEEQLKPIEYVMCASDGIVRSKEFLCESCYNSLDEGLETQKSPKAEDQ